MKVVKSARFHNFCTMLISKYFPLSTVMLIAVALLSFSNAYAQNDEVEVEVPTAKNTIAIRPQYALFGFYGISYERYIAGNYSIYGYAEFSDGPKLLGKTINTWVQNSMGVDQATIYYTGYGGAIGVRRYFTDKQYSLVGNKDLGALVGWFVGAHVPVRKMVINLDIKSVESFYSFPVQDKGSYSFDGLIYGLGIEGGRHWVWDLFSFEINAGLTYMQGIPQKGSFTFTRPPIPESYKVDKNLGLVNFYGTFAPKFEIVMGIGF